jgi:hypothetical protein
MKRKRKNTIKKIPGIVTTASSLNDDSLGDSQTQLHTYISSSRDAATTTIRPPDLLSDHAIGVGCPASSSSDGGGGGSKAASEQSAAGSYRMAMENIIDEYSR